eukprot:SAG31_NODE_14616_length_796_cov_1.175036_1_plen_44_part_10
MAAALLEAAPTPFWTNCKGWPERAAAPCPRRARCECIDAQVPKR